MTLVVLSLASSQLRPRLPRGFVRAAANQVLPGTFAATFVFCLLVLRTVRHADEVAFVPHVLGQLRCAAGHGQHRGADLRHPPRSGLDPGR